MATCISLHNAVDDDSDFSVQFYSDVIPRVGDDVCFWVDYPRHMIGLIDPEPGEPQKVTGVVSRVVIDYRYMRGWVATNAMHTQVGVWLDNYEAELFPHGKPREE